MLPILSTRNSICIVHVHIRMYALLHTRARARLWCCSYMSLVYERTNNERISFEVGICVCVHVRYGDWKIGLFVP